jgi:hypothetical protein
MVVARQQLARRQLECSPLMLAATTVQRKVLAQLQRLASTAAMIAAPTRAQH